MNNKLELLTDKNEIISLEFSEVKSIQQYMGIDTIPNVNIASSTYQYIELRTLNQTYNIIRNCKNDEQLLNFMLSK
jgi:hypothetical protein